jgi:GNAT superfamily N-acetyltransferase
VTIRLARADDVSLLCRLVERAYSVYIGRIGRRPAPMDDNYAEKVREGQVFVADHGGIAGLVVLIAAADHLLIENVAVEPDHQGTGIGGALMAYADDYAYKRNLGELRLYTNAAMTENLALYRHLGYIEVDRRAEHGFERVFFSKPTPPQRAL